MLRPGAKQRETVDRPFELDPAAAFVLPHHGAGDGEPLGEADAHPLADVERQMRMKHDALVRDVAGAEQAGAGAALHRDVEADGVEPRASAAVRSGLRANSLTRLLKLVVVRLHGALLHGQFHRLVTVFG